VIIYELSIIYIELSAVYAHKSNYNTRRQIKQVDLKVHKGILPMWSIIHIPHDAKVPLLLL